MRTGMTRPKPEKTDDSSVFKNRSGQSFFLHHQTYHGFNAAKMEEREKERKIFADIMKRYLKERDPLKEICMRSIFNRLMLRRKRKEKGIEHNFVYSCFNLKTLDN